MNNYKKTLSYGYDQTIPVFHYGSSMDYLEEYIKLGAKYIALGDTAAIRDKKRVIRWIRDIVYSHQDVSFHLLGNMSPAITSCCPLLHSCDSSTWIRQAAFGFPPQIEGRNREAKIRRADYNLQMEEWGYVKPYSL